MKTRIKIKKGLIPKSKRWFCYSCYTVTKNIEVRDEEHGNLLHMKCLSCNSKNYLDDYSCPKCGTDSDPWEMKCTFKGDCKHCKCEGCEFHKAVSKTLVSLDDSRYNYSASMEYGSCYDWTETHKCSNCNTVFEFYNTNC